MRTVTTPRRYRWLHRIHMTQKKASTSLDTWAVIIPEAFTMPWLSPWSPPLIISNNIALYRCDLKLCKQSTSKTNKKSENYHKTNFSKQQPNFKWFFYIPNDLPRVHLTLYCYLEISSFFHMSLAMSRHIAYSFVRVQKLYNFSFVCRNFF